MDQKNIYAILCRSVPLTIYNPSHNLRSSSRHLLSVGYMWTVSSSPCYIHSAATNWNVFKRKLKSSFSIAYIA